MSDGSSGGPGHRGLPAAIDPDFVPDRVSVIIPTYNRKHMLGEAIASVANQTWPDVEIIVVDDGSTDGTTERLTEDAGLTGKGLLKFERQENGGVASARNRGLSLATGEFIFFLDSDDLIFADALAALVEGIKRSGSRYCLAHIQVSDLEGNVNQSDGSGISIPAGKNIVSGYWLTHAALYHRQALVEAGGFNTSLRIAEDTEFQWRIVATSGSGTLVPSFVGLRRVHDHGHLSLGRPYEQIERHLVDAWQVFAHWQEVRGFTSSSVGLRYLLGILGLGIRFGRAGDWEYKDKAFALPSRLRSNDKAIALLSATLGWPRSQPFYGLLYISLKAAKYVARMSRPAANRNPQHNLSSEEARRIELR